LGSGLHNSILAHPTITSFPIGSDQYGHFPLVPVAVSLWSRCSKLHGDWLLMVLLDVHFLQIVFTPLDFFHILLFHCHTYNTPYRQGLILVVAYVMSWESLSRNRAQCRQSPRGQPGSVCFPSETGRQVHLSAGQPTTQGQIYTAGAYQEDTECS
jgi:hypothetical protein